MNQKSTSENLIKIVSKLSYLYYLFRVLFVSLNLLVLDLNKMKMTKIFYAVYVTLVYMKIYFKA